MSNYLLEIETEFSRGRGTPSRLSPMDWQLAQTFWDRGIPLHVVLGAMGEAFKNHADRQPARPINSLRYFESAVEEKFNDWKAGQTGKNNAPISRKMPDLEETMQNLPVAVMSAQIDENVEILSGIAAALPVSTEPEPLCSAILRLRGELLALIDEARSKNLSIDETETRLAKLRVEFEPSLIVSVSEDERAAVVAQTRKEYGKFQLLPEAEQKVLIRKLYQKFGIPELTLFAI